MFKPKYLIAVLAVVTVALFASPTFAQTSGPVRGVVKVQKADGTQTPVAGATVESYRVDLGKGAGPSATTNKKGEFSFVGFQLGATYALSVSAPGISPVVEPAVKAGNENLVILTSEGDGRKATEDEVRAFVASGAGKVPAGKSSEKTKEQAELERKNAEILAKNEKIKSGDETARKANTEGVEALKAKNYDLAIAKFEEGVQAVPDFVGSTPIMLNGKLVALKARGFDKYREGAPMTDLDARRAKYDAANQDYNDALKAFDQAMAVIKAAEAPASPTEQKQRDAVKLELLSNAMEVHRLKAVSGIDGSKADAAATVIEEYIALEPDAAKKITARTTLGDIMRGAGQFDKAITAYKTVLETAPDNLEVMASLGLSLVALGTSVDPPNKDQLQEGLNYMAKYADTVQILPTDSKNVQEFKQSVKDTVQYLKTDQKLKAQPPPKTPVKRGKG
jgi:tetratricopeptide (TPR) repeat protein